jgi:hypothetical protein
MAGYTAFRNVNEKLLLKHIYWKSPVTCIPHTYRTAIYQHTTAHSSKETILRIVVPIPYMVGACQAAEVAAHR